MDLGAGVHRHHQRINIIGLKLANGINALLMLVQFLVLIAFVALCVHYIGGDASTPLWSIKPFFNGDMHMPLIMSGAAIACYSFLGFDAVSTLTEETRDPRRTIPRAIMLITLIGGLIFVGVSYFVQIAHPSFQFDSVDSAAYEIARNIGGDLFVSIFLIGLIVGQFASGLSAQASGSRLLFAMAVTAFCRSRSSALCTRASAHRSTASCCAPWWRYWR